jgi:hypothetical protein
MIVVLKRRAAMAGVGARTSAVKLVVTMVPVATTDPVERDDTVAVAAGPLRAKPPAGTEASVAVGAGAPAPNRRAADVSSDDVVSKLVLRVWVEAPPAAVTGR